MNCRRAFNIDLSAFVVDAAAPEYADFKAHYPGCPDCAAEVRVWRELEDQLRSPAVAGADEHPDEALLLQLEDDPDGLARPDRLALESHLEDCPSCRDELAALRAFVLPAPAAQPEAPTPTWGEVVADLAARTRALLLHPAFAYTLVVALLVPTVLTQWTGVLPSGDPVAERSIDREPVESLLATADSLPPAGEVTAERALREPRLAPSVVIGAASPSSKLTVEASSQDATATTSDAMAVERASRDAPRKLVVRRAELDSGFTGLADGKSAPAVEPDPGSRRPEAAAVPSRAQPAPAGGSAKIGHLRHQAFMRRDYIPPIAQSGANAAAGYPGPELAPGRPGALAEYRGGTADMGAPPNGLSVGQLRHSDDEIDRGLAGAVEKHAATRGDRSTRVLLISRDRREKFSYADVKDGVTLRVPVPGAAARVTVVRLMREEGGGMRGGPLDLTRTEDYADVSVPPRRLRTGDYTVFVDLAPAAGETPEVRTYRFEFEIGPVTAAAPAAPAALAAPGDPATAPGVEKSMQAPGDGGLTD